MRVLATGLLVLVASAGASGAPVPKERTTAEKVVGAWKLVLGPNGETDIDLVLELHAGGKLIIRQTADGVTDTYEGTYRVKDNELPYEVKLPNGEVKKETLTIKKLTETELVVVDPDGLKEEFKRVVKKEEKKKD